MEVRAIVAEWLKANGYDGLYTDNCGCEVDDLMPCANDGSANCRAGYKIPCRPETCPADGDCPWHIGPKKQQKWAAPKPRTAQIARVRSPGAALV